MLKIYQTQFWYICFVIFLNAIEKFNNIGNIEKNKNLNIKNIVKNVIIKNI